ncbi:short-chain dehydrogenase [Chitinophaga caeni]|uniref:Short-chain dehydrogenase n=1 Tax=Chitinophaga caeni TaxID=2029983 RepID=A0A291QYA1_9BACT|nr:SDR family NAD(P)-dependent oxidoreductase [Chitinophaga caeni]ATL48925.1 short-chain dehydrogenase [Chitinophaga caeni]
MNLRNNTILITGGTSGFGFDFASKLITLGNTVIITGRNLEKLRKAKLQLPPVHIYQSDVSKPEDITRLFNDVTARFPGLNILINNAGEMRKISLHHQHDLEDITREVEINLMGPVRMVQQFLPHLEKQPEAAIVNVTSGIALGAFPLSPIYSASKSGLRAYTQSLRVQLKNTGIKVFELLAPGSTTSLNDKFMGEDGFSTRFMMAPEKVVDAALKGIERDKDEILPGASKLLKVLSRLAPKLALAQASKIGASYMYGK